MTQDEINRNIDGSAITVPVVSVQQLAAQLNEMIKNGQGEMPIFTSDGRGRYPFATVIPYTKSGYADCLLIQPLAHLHVEVKETLHYQRSYFEEINNTADRIRKSCGAFA